MKSNVHHVAISGAFILAALLSQGSAHAQYQGQIRYNPNPQFQYSWQAANAQQTRQIYNSQLYNAQVYAGNQMYNNQNFFNGTGLMPSTAYYPTGPAPSRYYPNTQFPSPSYTPVASPYYGGSGGAYGYGGGGAYGYGGGAYGYGGGAYGYGGGAYGYGGGGWDPGSAGYGAGQALQGEAALTQAYGKLSTTYAQARLYNEQYNQMKIDTKKKQFDLDEYIRSRTPNYTEQQAKIAEVTLRRIQKNALPGEVVNGKALNYLLDDLRKAPNRKISLEPINLSEGVLSRLNVTRNNYGIGILRNDGKFIWPGALQEMVGLDKRKDINLRTQILVTEALSPKKGKLDVVMLRDLRADMNKILDDLKAKINDFQTTDYLAGKRFLQEFQDATYALERGDAEVQVEFQRFIDGGKSVQEITDKMVREGWRFGPAIAGDDSAYRAFHAALANYDIAMNAHGGGGYVSEK